jgi:RNA polymerase-interacting CarD/CdnL/TRCF family regulator
MMKFNIGETIIEPTNGICVMRGMKRMKVDGKEMTVYIFDAQSAKVFVPADQIEKRNIRRPMNREDVKRCSRPSRPRFPPIATTPACSTPTIATS